MIERIQQAQAANNQIIAALKPRGAFGRALQVALTEVHRFALIITHVDTGALRASHRMQLNEGALYGLVYIDPAARNPLTGERTGVYGPAEHARGGEHAFYERVVNERGQQIMGETAGAFVRGLP